MIYLQPVDPACLPGVFVKVVVYNHSMKSRCGITYLCARITGGIGCARLPLLRGTVAVRPA